MGRQSDGLRADRPQAQLGTMHGDTETNEVGELRELSANQVLSLAHLPFVPDAREVRISQSFSAAFALALDPEPTRSAAFTDNHSQSVVRNLRRCNF
jgi:hypothetical protein